MGIKKLKYVEGNMFQYEIYDLVDKYDPILYKPTEEYKFNKDYFNPEQDAGYIALSLSETMQSLGGLGLSANQVGLSHRVCAINMGDRVVIMFNPKITNRLGVSSMKEGCLSFPGLYLSLNRAEAITIQFQGIDGKEQIVSLESIAAVCAQHEIDHLDGICYTKKVSPIVLEREKLKIKKNLKNIKKNVNKMMKTA
jgi:peptide deformylase